MKNNSMYSANMARFYGRNDPATIESYYDELDDLYGIDYTIEDAKANINIRLKQSQFRKSVLENFNNQCCISGIYEESVLVASHIVPWSAYKKYRSDPGNGLCLFIEYDAYFDKGYITIDNNLYILITNKLNTLSDELQNRLKQLEGKKLTQPLKYKIKHEYIKYHHDNIWNHFDAK